MRSNESRLKIANTRIMIILSMILPFFLAMVSFLLISSYNYHRNKEMVLDNCLSSMQLFSQRYENEIMNVVHSSIFLGENAYFNAALNRTADFSNSTAMFNIKNIILNFEEANPVVRDVLIIDQSREHVISADGLYSFDNYFDDIVSYKNYNLEYWKNYRPFAPTQYTILSPSAISTQNGDDAVLPILIFENYNARFKNILLVNISIDALIDIQNTYISNLNASIFLMNNYSGDIFYRSDGTMATDNVLNSELYKKLLNEKYFTQDIFDRGKCFIVPYSTQKNLSGYTYFGAIPYYTLHKVQASEVLIAVFVFLLFFAIMVLYYVNYADRILTPIRKTLEIISKKNVSYDNIFEQLETEAANISGMNDALLTTFPYAQEKYLISFLSSADYSITEEAKTIIKNSLPFQYEYFAVVIIQTYPTKLFFETYNKREYTAIQSGLYTVVKQMFSEKFQSFSLTGEKDVLNIIINVQNDCVKEDIEKVIAEIGHLLMQDNEYLNVYVGLSGIYKDWEGLKYAYSEAIENLKYIHQELPKNKIKQREYLNDAKISKLYNAIVAFDITYAKQLIDEYCINAEDDQRLLKQLYTQILTTIFKVMRTRNISYNDNQLDFEIYSNILTKSCADIYKEIVLLLDTISIAKAAEASVNLGEEIINYINDNYGNEDLSLDSLAGKFNVQPTYVSTIVKNTIGVGFHKYLTTIRISKAKELLAHSNMGIKDIYESCGFVSKSTFFRAFKQDTGVTPRVYQESQKNDTIYKNSTQ